MKKIIGFLKLIRFVNLLFIAFTQYVFYHFVVVPVYMEEQLHQPVLDEHNMYLIILASVSIAAGGYIINDYFDVNIDLINKPNRTLVGTIIKRRTAILLHLFFSLLGIVLTGYVAFQINQSAILIINVICVIALWYYSTTLKKKLFYGNVLISLMTAWVVLILYVCEIKLVSVHTISAEFTATLIIYKYAILYGGFAFLVSLLREIVKDMEDIEGDRLNSCHTLPIAWGIPITKMILNALILLINVLISIFSFYMLMQGGIYIAFFFFLFILLPLFYVRKRIVKSVTSSDMHRISTIVKFILLAGICSMIFFKISI